MHACMQYVAEPERLYLPYTVLDFEDGQNPMIVCALQVILQDQVRLMHERSKLAHLMILLSVPGRFS